MDKGTLELLHSKLSDLDSKIAEISSLRKQIFDILKDHESKQQAAAAAQALVEAQVDNIENDNAAQKEGTTADSDAEDQLNLSQIKTIVDEAVQNDQTEEDQDALEAIDNIDSPEEVKEDAQTAKEDIEREEIKLEAEKLMQSAPDDVEPMRQAEEPLQESIEKEENPQQFDMVNNPETISTIDPTIIPAQTLDEDLDVGSNSDLAKVNDAFAEMDDIESQADIDKMEEELSKEHDHHDLTGKVSEEEEQTEQTEDKAEADKAEETQDATEDATEQVKSETPEKTVDTEEPAAKTEEEPTVESVSDEEPTLEVVDEETIEETPQEEPAAEKETAEEQTTAKTEEEPTAVSDQEPALEIVDDQEPTLEILDEETVEETPKQEPTSEKEAEKEPKAETKEEPVTDTEEDIEVEDSNVDTTVYEAPVKEELATATAKEEKAQESSKEDTIFGIEDKGVVEIRDTNDVSRIGTPAKETVEDDAVLVQPRPVQKIITPTPHPSNQGIINTVRSAGLKIDEMLSRQNSRNLFKAFTLNDKFRFRRELFHGKDVEMAEALDRISLMDNYGQAEDYFYETLGLNPNNEDVKDFMMVIKNHFASL